MFQINQELSFLVEICISKNSLFYLLQVGHANRHGYILAIQDSRRKFGKVITKEEFLKLKDDWEAINTA